MRNEFLPLRQLPTQLMVLALALVSTECSLGGVIGLAGDQLIAIDTATGAGSLVGGSFRFGTVKAIAARGDEIFAVELGSSMGDAVLQIDPTTGEQSFVVGTSRVNGSGGLSFGPNDALYFGNVSSNTLWTIDPDTGQLTSVGALGPAVGSVGIGGLAFDGADFLYAADTFDNELLRIDAATGEASVVGPFGLAVNVQGLTFDDQGNLFGADTVADQLLRIDINTGAATVVGPIGFSDVVGLTFLPVVVPEPSTVALAALPLGMLARGRRNLA